MRHSWARGLNYDYMPPETDSGERRARNSHMAIGLNYEYIPPETTCGYRRARVLPPSYSRIGITLGLKSLVGAVFRLYIPRKLVGALYCAPETTIGYRLEWIGSPAIENNRD